MSDEIENFRGYNGNQNLKRFGVQVNWTPEMVQEWMKCSQDVVYFVKKYMKIVNVDRGLIPFEPYDYQVEMLHSMQQERYCIFATSRQAGKCQNINTPITVRNKKTGQVITMTVGEFHEKIRSEKLPGVQSDLPIGQKK